MGPQAMDGRVRRTGWRTARTTRGAGVRMLFELRSAFSLAEMMIALAILAMGLLVIGAALPVGARYTQQSVNLATGEAAAEYALDQIEQNVSLVNSVYTLVGGVPVLNREPGLFQPRGTLPWVISDPNNPANLGVFNRSYEPLIKVRALCTQNVSPTPGASYGGEMDPTNPNNYLVFTEEFVRYWTAITFGVDPNSVDAHECDPAAPSYWLRPALPSAAMVYPPPTRDLPWTQASFFVTDGPYARQQPTPSESLKVLGQRTVWTAFYRRVSYPPDPSFAPPGTIVPDPDLYEFIVVVSRLPSAKYRFPIQAPGDPGQIGGNQPFLASSSHGGGGGTSTVSGASDYNVQAPIPWLVTFDWTQPLPAPAYGFNRVTGLPQGPNPYTPWQAPATLTFYCRPGRSGLFPVGAIFIPARNDVAPGFPNIPIQAQFRIGFSPPSPTALPIYEVIERPDDRTIITKYNGFYPLMGSPGTYGPIPFGVGANQGVKQWPVWVVPPAYSEGTQVGGPIMPNRSPIVAVVRRYIHLRETP